MSVLALDIGSSRIKALLADWDGGSRRVRGVPTPHRSIEEGELAYPPEAVLAASTGLIAELAAETAADPVDTVVLTCLGTAMVPVAADGTPLGAALAPADRRPMRGPRLPEQVDMEAAELRRITGSDPAVASSLLHLLWWRSQHPDVMTRVHRFRSLRGYLVQELCGVDVEDPSWSSRSMLLDIETNTWSGAILDAAALPPELLPEIAPSTAAFPVRARMREQLGLGPQTVVVHGGLDNCCALLGATSEDGSGLVNIVGTYEHMAAAGLLSDVRAAAAAGGGIVHSYLLPGVHIGMTRVELGGLLDAVTDADDGSLAQLLDAVSETPTGQSIALERDAVVAELGAGRSRARVLQAVIESAAMVLKRFAEAWSARMPSPGPVVAVGGGARHGSVLRLKAEMLGRPFSTLRDSEGAGFGALRLAAIAVRGSSPAEACERFANPIVQTFRPRGA